jgi:hypothetical protein
MYHGIVLSAARRAFRPHRAGQIDYLLSRYDGGTVIVRPVNDGYYVVVALRPGSDVGSSLLRSAAAQDRMNEEI